GDPIERDQSLRNSESHNLGKRRFERRKQLRPTQGSSACIVDARRDIGNDSSATSSLFDHGLSHSGSVAASRTQANIASRQRKKALNLAFPDAPSRPSGYRFLEVGL